MDTLGTIPLTCAPKSAGGIRRLWVADRAAFGRWRLTETATLQYGMISGAENAGEWFPLYFVRQQGTFTEAVEPLPARGYAIDLTAPYCRISVAHRDAFERIVVSESAVFAAEDQNGNTWLIGEPAGCLVETQYGTQTPDGGGMYSLAARCRQRWPLRLLDPEYVSGSVSGESLVQGFSSLSSIQLQGMTTTQILGLIR